MDSLDNSAFSNAVNTIGGTERALESVGLACALLPEDLALTSQNAPRPGDTAIAGPGTLCSERRRWKWGTCEGRCFDWIFVLKY